MTDNYNVTNKEDLYKYLDLNYTESFDIRNDKTCGDLTLIQVQVPRRLFMIWKNTAIFPHDEDWDKMFICFDNTIEGTTPCPYCGGRIVKRGIDHGCDKYCDYECDLDPDD